MLLPDLVQWYAPEKRNRSLGIAFLAISVIAVADYLIKPNIGLGSLYLFPILLAAGFLSRRYIAATAFLCAILRETFSPFHHNIEAIPRTALVWSAFMGVGLFMRELVWNRQQTVEHIARLKTEIDLRAKESRLREEAERQLQALIESSPAAILTITESGAIDLANDAAHKLLTATSPLAGRDINQFLPDTSVIQKRLGSTSTLRTAVECRGVRENGQFFLGQLWMSRFLTHAGPRIAVIISDASEQLRDREEIGLEQSLNNSRILVSAVSHEIRNLCSAVAIAYTNLGRLPGIEETSDYKSLGMLVQGLRSLATAELMPATKAASEGLQLKTVFDDLRIVLQAAGEEADANVEWNLPLELPPVRVDRQGLFQVFLNLSHNSFRAMQVAVRRALTISAEFDEEFVKIRFRDTGTGVDRPQELFRLFQSGSGSTGIGLYISRAILRSYGGDLRYEVTESGACFAIELLRSKGMMH